jgi:hypothetical protein
MVFNATFKNISIIWWRSVLLVEETGVLGENRPAAVCYFCSIEEKHCKHISNVYYRSKNCMFFTQALQIMLLLHKRKLQLQVT